MKKTILKTFALVLVLCFGLSLCACSGMSDEEIKTLATGLIEASYEINEIFYGKGIDVDDRKYELAKEQLYQDTDVKIAVYAEADMTYKYQTTNDLKAAALKVYSTSYCEGMFEIAFTGHKDPRNGAIVDYARFIDNEYARVAQRVDKEEQIFYQGRTYDMDSFTIIKHRAKYIIFEADSYIDGASAGRVKLKMVKDIDGTWKLDTPTY